MPRSEYECPVCHVRSRVRLNPGQVCANCNSKQAWDNYRGGPLVVRTSEVRNVRVLRDGGRPRRVPVTPFLLFGGAMLVALSAVSVLKIVESRLEEDLVSFTLHVPQLAIGGGITMVLAATVLGFGIVWAHLNGNFGDTGLRAGAAMTGICIGVCVFLVATTWLRAPSRAGRAFRGRHALGLISRIAGGRAFVEGDAVLVRRTGDVGWILTDASLVSPRSRMDPGGPCNNCPEVAVVFPDNRLVPGQVIWIGSPLPHLALIRAGADQSVAPAVLPDVGAGLTSADIAEIPVDGLRTTTVRSRQRYDLPSGHYFVISLDIWGLTRPGTPVYDSSGKLAGIVTSDPQSSTTDGSQAVEVSGAAVSELISRFQTQSETHPELK